MPWQSPAPFLERAGPPGQLTAFEQQLGQLPVARSETRERGDHARRAVAPLRANRLVGALERLGHRWPLADPVAALGIGRHGCGRPPLELDAPFDGEQIPLGEGEHAAGEAVRRPTYSTTLP